MPSYHGLEDYFTTMSQLPRGEEGIQVQAGEASRAGTAVPRRLKDSNLWLAFKGTVLDGI